MSLKPSDIFQINDYHQKISDLHGYLHTVERFPHEGQFPVLRAFFQEKKKIIMGCCGRSHGKTEEILYIAWRYALTRPNSEIWIICPEIKQAERIYWLPKRLQNYGPREYIEDISKGDLRIIFKNGSWIKLDGCENYNSLRGIKPHLVIYDEFQHHSKDFDEEVMQPNLASGITSLVVMGTPPKRACYFTEFRDNLFHNIANGDKDKIYVELPSSANPTLSKEWLAKKKEELIRRGKLNVWLREYEGKVVYDTESAVFPFFSALSHSLPRAEIEQMLEQDKRKLHYYAMFDPGTATVFAVLFIAHNPYTNQVYILDEIYAQGRDETRSFKIWAEAQKKMEAICDDESRWRMFYDEAAAWFANEVGGGLIPTHKQAYSAARMADEGRPGESILNTLMEKANHFIAAAECTKFLWEMENYVTNERGEYPKKDDHLIDDLFYFVNEARITLSADEDREIAGLKRERKTSRTPELLIANGKSKADWSEGLEDSSFYDDDYMEDMWTQ